MVELTIEYDVLQLFKPFLLGFCNCGCGKNVKFHDDKLRCYIKGHRKTKEEIIPEDRKTFRMLGEYWIIYMPKYFSSWGNGCVYEHIYNYQEYHKCCMLNWGVVHHVNEIKTDNRIENLQGMMKHKHLSHHNKGKKRIGVKINMSDRRCSRPDCDDPTRVYITKGGYAQWFTDGNGGFLCLWCFGRRHSKRRYKRRKNL